MNRARTAVALAVLLAILVSAGSAGAASLRAPERMLLRLHELPRQYRIGDDSGCGVFAGAETEVPAALEAWFRHRSRGCVLQYERLFPLPGTRSAPVVESLAIANPSVAAAEEGFAIADQLVEFTKGDGFVPAPTTAALGAATALFHSDDSLVFGQTGRPATELFWRSGLTLSAIYVGGLRPALADPVALRLARIQQRHVEHPTAYTKAERDWTTVPLEDPRIRLPIYWTGRGFHPLGFPAARLANAEVGRIGPPGVRARLEYTGFSLSSFTRRSWREWDTDPFGDLIRHWRCTSAKSIDLPRGSATIYAGYSKDFESCPPHPPDVFMAEVHLGRIVIGIDLPNCPACIETGHTPYYSVGGMEAIARGLRLRRPG